MPRWSIVSGTHVKYDRGIPGIKAGANDFIVVHEICDADGNKKSEDGGVNPKAKVVIAKGTAARDRVVRLIERGSFQPNNAGISVSNVIRRDTYVRERSMGYVWDPGTQTRGQVCNVRMGE